MNPDKWSTIIGYFIIIAVMVAGFAAVNVSRESSVKDSRTILCTGIIANTTNPARDDPEVIRLCRDAGVDIADYPVEGG